MAQVQTVAASPESAAPTDQPADVLVVPVKPGEIIQLPLEPKGLQARADINGNLAIKNGSEVVVLQGYIAADLQDHVTLLADNGTPIDLPPLIADTESAVDFPAAGGFSPNSSLRVIGPIGHGTFMPLAGLSAVGPLSATGVLDDTDGPPPSPDPFQLLDLNDTELLPPANKPPTASDLTLAAVEDGGPVNGTLIASDPDADDLGNLTLTILTEPALGTLTDNGDGTVTYDPGAHFQDLSEAETTDLAFTYVATDSHGAVSNLATGNITVTGVNDAPTATNTSYSTSEDGPVVAGSLVADDVDNDDDPTTLEFELGASPAKGTLLDNGDGTFSFDPGEDFSSLDDGESEDVSFTYQAKDTHGALSAAATTTITITGVNDAPVAAHVKVAATEGGSPVAGAFSATDDDDVAGSLVYAISIPPDRGTVTNNDDGTFSFDPGVDFQELAQGKTTLVEFAYTATDPDGLTSDIALGLITVTGVNDAPTTANAGYTIAEDGPPIIRALAGDDIDSDDDAKSLTYLLSGLSGGGTLTNNGNGSFSFDPNTDFDFLKPGDNADVSFTYQTKDSHGALSVASTVTITVTGINDPPVAEDVALDAQEDGGPVIGGFGGTDPENEDINFIITSQPAEGSVVDNHDNTFTFDPGMDFQDLAEDETRIVAFNYDAVDSEGAISKDATATVTVTGVNDDPISTNIILSEVRGGHPITHKFDGDDIDNDDDKSSLLYDLVSQTSKGLVTNNGNGTFTYAAGDDFDNLGPDDSETVSFTYTATDAHGAVSNTATVFITVFGTNTPPVAGDVAVTTNENTKITQAFGATDAQDLPQELSYAILSGPSGGTVTVNPNGTFTFDPGADFQDLGDGDNEDVTFTYQATDSQDLVSNVATATITVGGLNDAPVASAVTAAAGEDGPVVTASFNADDVDGDDDPASLTYQVLINPTAGTLTNNNDGTFSFDPGAGFHDLVAGATRSVNFTYRAIDSHGTASNTATGTIIVAGANDAPTAGNLNAVVLEGIASAPIAFNADDSDSDDSPSTLTYIISQPSGGTVTDNGDGTFNFDSGTDFDFLLQGETSDVTFTYTATDKHGAVSAPATVTITVTGRNVIPVSEDCPIPSAAILATYEFDPGTQGDDRANNNNRVNHWMQGYAGNDNLAGGNSPDLIEGGAGDDTLDGQGGSDVLLGGSGNDRMNGAALSDCLDGDAGDDTISGGTGDDELHGNDGNDSLDGGSDDDEIEGGAGNDNITGGSGDDTISGNNGDDSIEGDRGNDRIDAGAGNDTLDGGIGDDVIFAGAGDDTIIVSGGNDQIIGGEGDDFIKLGTGVNTVFYTSLIDGLDVITSFDGNPVGGEDVLNLDQLFDALEVDLGPLDQTTRAGMVHLTQNGGDIEVAIDADNDAGTAAITIAIIQSNDPITVGEDIVVA